MLRRILGRKSGKRQIIGTQLARKPRFESLERRMLMYGAGLLMSAAASGIAPEPADDTARETGDATADTVETASAASVTQAKSPGAALELRLVRRRVPVHGQDPNLESGDAGLASPGSSTGVVPSTGIVRATLNTGIDTPGDADEGRPAEAATAVATPQANHVQTENASTTLRTASMVIARASADAAAKSSTARESLTEAGTTAPSMTAEAPAVAVEAEDSLPAPINRAAILRQMGQAASNPTVRGESDSEPDVTSPHLVTSTTPQPVVTIVLRRRAAIATPGNGGASDAGSSSNQSPASSDNTQPSVPPVARPGEGQAGASDGSASVGEKPVTNSPLTSIPNVLELGAAQKPNQVDDNSPHSDDPPEPADAQPQPSMATIGLGRLLRNQGETGQAQPKPTDVSGPSDTAPGTPSVEPDEVRSLLAAARPNSSLAGSHSTPPWSDLVDVVFGDSQEDEPLQSVGSELRLLWL